MKPLHQPSEVTFQRLAVGAMLHIDLFTHIAALCYSFVCSFSKLRFQLYSYTLFTLYQHFSWNCYSFPLPGKSYTKAGTPAGAQDSPPYSRKIFSWPFRGGTFLFLQGLLILSLLQKHSLPPPSGKHFA